MCNDFEDVVESESGEVESVGMGVDEVEVDGVDEDTCLEVSDDFDSEIGATIGSFDDIISLDLNNLTPYDLRNVVFVSVDMAYTFYHWFARVNGFVARKSTVVRNKEGHKLQQTFVCN